MHTSLITSICFTVISLGSGGCQAPAKVQIERPVPAPVAGEPASFYSVAASDAGGLENAAALCNNLVVHVRGELVGYGLLESPDHQANRSIRLKIVEFRDVPDLVRVLGGMFAGSDRFLVDVEVLSTSPESVIGVARVVLSDMQAISPTNENYMVSEVAEKIVDFIRGKAVNAPPAPREEP
jgi:hypothetical protein